LGDGKTERRRIHDFGTTFKAYRREILEQVPLYGELHRFIPALASWHGASICEVPIRNVNRERGVSHYGISRTFRVFSILLLSASSCATCRARCTSSVPGDAQHLRWQRHRRVAYGAEVIAAMRMSSLRTDL